eukprot:14340301-Alexandrium_andersonii.AAC.1
MEGSGGRSRQASGGPRRHANERNERSTPDPTAATGAPCGAPRCREPALPSAPSNQRLMT